MTPNDPLYANQWHLRMLGNIETIWNDYTGAGIHVGVYDSGVDYRHPDLKTRYDATRHVVVDGRVLVPDPDDSPGNENNWHGTGAAGLIAATGNNRTGVVGVSWGASLTGVNILGKTSPAYLNDPDPVGFLSAIHQMTRFDVTNGSWNATPGYASTFQNLNNPSAFAARLAAEYAYVSANGRGGLGTVIVQSAGNDDLDVNGNGTNVTRHNITVAAANQDGFVSSYSNYGSSVLITAPGSETEGSIVTTDRSGTAGRTSGDYMGNYNGTSAAAPIVSGAVALMLQANPNLGWRDVQTILALSSTHTGTRIGASQHSAEENNFWQVNRADTWNGGGMHYSNDYGYGMLDVYGAVRMAEAWKHFSPTAQTSANEVRFSTGNLTVNGNNYIPDGSFLNVTLNVTASMILEHVDLTLTFRHGNFNFVNIYAYSPEGTRVLLHDGSTGEWNTAANGLTWTFGIDSLRGEAAAGTWTIQFVDTYPETADGFFTNVELVAYGTRPTADDVYHYTDELVEMSALNAARLSLNDTDGGIDWIDAAAVTGNCFVNLGPGGKTTIAGKEIAMGSGVIECAVTGDGNDFLVANSARNTLVGGRGNDTYLLDSATDAVVEKSGQGADTVIASVSYRLAAGQSVETLLAANKTGTARIDLTGNELVNALQGTNGANRLDGGRGADTMTGLGGDDTYVVDNARDRTVEAGGTTGGIDTVLASVSTVLAGFVENLTLTGTAALTGTGNGHANRMTGNTGANVLDGKGGRDTMAGGRGDDTYVVDNLGDLILEAAGQGRDGVRSGVNYALAAGQEIESLATTRDAGTGAINLNGNEFANTIRGNAGANILAGKLGADTLTGLSGADSFLFNSGLSSRNVDHITDFSVRDDTIRLDDAVFTQFAVGTLASGLFKDVGNAGARTDADDRILYDHRSGGLYYDKDGSGVSKAVLFAVIDTKALLTFQDFLVV
ncbi:MAG: S8 family serine peptidase [Methylorubrum rhodinum]|uniref:S8 family serine peptidase n=1 Tax=Methylorubrum rhodinum TaxID=29428 RepID=UPI003BB07DDF